MADIRFLLYSVYSILLYALVHALIVWRSEVMEEVMRENDAYYPSFTICHTDVLQNNEAFESFGGVESRKLKKDQLLSQDHTMFGQLLVQKDRLQIIMEQIHFSLLSTYI